MNPCRACARSPTIVKLRDGQRSSSICHSASVSSCASSTTMCANGPASRSGSALGRPALVDQRVLEVLPAQHRHDRHLGVVGGDQVVDDSRISSRSAASTASAAAGAADASGSPIRCRAASSSGRSDTVQARGSSGAAARGHPRPPARERTAAGRRARTTGPRPTPAGSSSGHARLNGRASSSFCMQRLGGTASAGTSSSLLVDQDRQQRPPRPDLAPRCAACRVPPPRTPRPSPRR